MLQWLTKFLNHIINTRFVPIELIIAIGGVAIGIWLLIIGISYLPDPYGTFAASWLLFVGVLHTWGLSRDETSRERQSLRRFATFFESLNFLYIAVLMAITLGVASFGWFGYLLLALIASATWLSLAIGE